MRTCLLALFFVTGCEIEPCDPGQTKVWNASCFPDMPPSGSGGSPSSGGSNGEPGGDANAGAGASNCSPSSQFGDACTVDADCLCPTNYCALPPGQATGSCTHTGCLEDSSVCPADFQCMDLSTFDPSLPSICVPPT